MNASNERTIVSLIMILVSVMPLPASSADWVMLTHYVDIYLRPQNLLKCSMPWLLTAMSLSAYCKEESFSEGKLCNSKLNCIGKIKV